MPQTQAPPLLYRLATDRDPPAAGIVLVGAHGLANISDPVGEIVVAKRVRQGHQRLQQLRCHPDVPVAQVRPVDVTGLRLQLGCRSEDFSSSNCRARRGTPADGRDETKPLGRVVHTTALFHRRPLAPGQAGRATWPPAPVGPHPDHGRAGASQPDLEGSPAGQTTFQPCAPPQPPSPATQFACALPLISLAESPSPGGAPILGVAVIYSRRGNPWNSLHSQGCSDPWGRSHIEPSKPASRVAWAVHM